MNVEHIVNDRMNVFDKLFYKSIGSKKINEKVENSKI